MLHADEKMWVMQSRLCSRIRRRGDWLYMVVPMGRYLWHQGWCFWWESCSHDDLMYTSDQSNKLPMTPYGMWLKNLVLICGTVCPQKFLILHVLWTSLQADHCIACMRRRNCETATSSKTAGANQHGVPTQKYLWSMRSFIQIYPSDFQVHLSLHRNQMAGEWVVHRECTNILNNPKVPHPAVSAIHLCLSSQWRK